LRTDQCLLINFNSQNDFKYVDLMVLNPLNVFVFACFVSEN